MYVAPGSRGRIASALHLDIVISGNPEDCAAVAAESAARTILVWPGERSALPADARPEFEVVKSVGECLDRLTTVDDRDSRKTGLLAWVRRLFSM